MVVDSMLYDDPNFKKKLFAVDDIVNNTYADRSRPMPGSEHNILRHQDGLDCDEVSPNIIVGNVAVARNKDYLKLIGVTHVLNCAHSDLGFNMVRTSEAYYEDVNIKFKGLKLDDIWTEDISRFFDESVHFIDQAMANGGKVLIHCFAGISRSATIAIAYLMLRHKHSVESAVRIVRTNRRVYPNEGFLRQLVQLDFKTQQTS